MQKSGSFFSYGELRLGQGRNNTKQYLAENPDTAREIEAKLADALGIERSGEPSEPTPIADTATGPEAQEPERKAA